MEARRAARLKFALELAVVAVVTVTFTFTIAVRNMPRPDDAVVLDTVIAAALDDYHPGEPFQTLTDARQDSVDAGYCWGRYLEVVAALGQASFRADSLAHELTALRVKVARGE